MWQINENPLSIPLHPTVVSKPVVSITVNYLNPSSKRTKIGSICGGKMCTMPSAALMSTQKSCTTCMPTSPWLPCRKQPTPSSCRPRQMRRSVRNVGRSRCAVVHAMCACSAGVPAGVDETKTARPHSRHLCSFGDLRGHFLVGRTPTLDLVPIVKRFSRPRSG